MEKILIAGASGVLGLSCLKALSDETYGIRTLSKHPERAKVLNNWTEDIWVKDATQASQLTHCCRDIDYVISCMGGSVSPFNLNRKSFFITDYQSNFNLLQEALKSGVKRFIYVSAWSGEGWNNNGYIQSHEQFVSELKKSALDYTVLRPTGLFSAMEEFLVMAKKGFISMPGNGQAKTNPVHQDDVAKMALKYLKEGPEEVGIGGPEILTRKEIAQLAFQALQRKERLIHVPPPIFNLSQTIIKPFAPRISELIQFFTQVSTTDAIAPQVGLKCLKEYFSFKAR